MWALALVVVVPVLYLLSGWFEVSWHAPGKGELTRAAWVGSGSVGYSSWIPGNEAPGRSGVRAHPFGLDGDFDLREQRGGWFFEYALWPLLMLAAVFFAWAWRWRALAVGGCEGCGYSLGGQAQCPECGRSASPAGA
jgi:hypothetical protein